MGDTNWEVLGAPDEKNPERALLGNFADPGFVAAARAFKEEYKDKKTVLICEPSGGLINYKAHEATCDLVASVTHYSYKSDYRFFKTCLGKLMVAYSREKFAEYAVNMGFDYLFFIDDDHIWPADIFQRLEKWLADYDIVAPLCVQRQEPFYPVIYKSTFRKEKGNVVWDNKKYVEVKAIRKGDIITDADAIGFGAAIVKVSLLMKIPRPWFFSMAPVGEDILFCGKAKAAANAKILIDTNVEAPHLMESEPADWRNYERCKKNLPGDAELEKQRDEADRAGDAGKQHGGADTGVPVP